MEEKHPPTHTQYSQHKCPKPQMYKTFSLARALHSYASQLEAWGSTAAHLLLKIQNPWAIKLSSQSPSMPIYQHSNIEQYCSKP